MQETDLYFVIPTYRLREVGETVEHYDEHFWCNGHSVKMIVFDDSSPANQTKYYSLLEQTQTHNELYYVGPSEKAQFEPDFFQQDLLRIVDGVISVIKGSIELWPTLVEICYFQKDRKGLPQIRVENRKK